MKLFNFKLTINFDKNSFTSLNWKVFWLSMIAGFFLAALQNYGQLALTTAVVQLKPGISKTEEIFDSLKPKLQDPGNTFKLKKKLGLVPKSYANSSLDNAGAYIVVDYNTGEIIAAKNEKEPRKIASLTKVMTTIISLELGSSDNQFTVTRNSANQQPTKIGLVPGQKLKLWELLHAVLLTSANDAAELVKEGINQKFGADIFVRAMNAKANFIGLKNTKFDNPQGFDGQENYSTAEDLAVLAHYALENYPLISEIVRKEYEFLPQNSDHKQYDLYNWNGLLGVYPQILGLKIGNTDAAGKTTIVVSERNGKKMLAVLLGAPGVLERDLWAGQLLDLGFHDKNNLQMVNISESQLKEKYQTWKYWN